MKRFIRELSYWTLAGLTFFPAVLYVYSLVRNPGIGYFFSTDLYLFLATVGVCGSTVCFAVIWLYRGYAALPE